MLIQLFDVQDKRVVANANTYLIPETKAIIDTFPGEYLKILAYIFFTTCPDGTNPYVSIDEETKEAVILADLQPFDFDLEEPLIIAAAEKCKLLYTTPVLRTFMGAKKMLEKIGKFLDEADITTGKDGNATEIRGIMKELSVYWENYSKLENVLKEEQAKVRGGVKIPYHQRPGYVDTKSDEYKNKNTRE